MKQGIIALLAVIGLGCASETPEMIRELRGNWVEVKKTTDTLLFTTLFNDQEFVVLKRAELYRTGPYTYEVLPGNKISMRWSLASTITPNEYYFKIRGNELTIGNFYDSPSGAILTFKKID